MSDIIHFLHIYWAADEHTEWDYSISNLHLGTARTEPKKKDNGQVEESSSSKETKPQVFYLSYLKDTAFMNIKCHTAQKKPSGYLDCRLSK